MSELRKIRRALISVSDKEGSVEFARSLARFGVTIISTGGTARLLRENGIDVTEVAEITGFPEMMDGRVKTLHPKIHGALLGLRDNPNHAAAMNENGIEPIDLVAINLYPFEQTVANPEVGLDAAVENIDIGGPAMIRSASKNWRDVAVVTDPALYVDIINEMRVNNGSLSLVTRKRLAVLAYTRTASYDLAISSYLAGKLDEADLEYLEPFNPLGHLSFIESAEMDLDTAAARKEIVADEPSSAMPDEIRLELRKSADLRYGENPHQSAALYLGEESGGVARGELLHGRQMSFNNYIDAEAAWNLVSDFDELAAAIIKHTNPSGVGTGSSNEEAYRRALSTDPVSAFGGIVAFNRPLDVKAAAAVTETFTEVVIAPDYTVEALEILKAKKNLRIVRIDPGIRAARDAAVLEYRRISGGMLVQEADSRVVRPEEIKIVTSRKPTQDELNAMMFAWRICKHVKSNAIVLANADQTIGVGAGQMNRVDSVRIAAIRAERFSLPIEGAALASDAFFPFRDNVDEAAAIGIKAIIQPGGSIKDSESIAAANEHGVTMSFTGIRHFKH